MSIEKLKEQARRHEQKEEWIKALDQYKKAIDRLAEDDQPDIGLYNRVGDLFVRVGNLDAAVEHYEAAVDLYMDAYLPNNAIAVCKKVIRNVPDRHTSYLKMGRIRAEQGFIPDARTNFLTYAERVAQSGDMEESLRALAEFTELAPEDVQVRLFLAEQLAAHDGEPDAVEHMVAAYHALRDQGDHDEAQALKERIQELDPAADLSARPPAEATSSDQGAFASFGEISLGGGDAAADATAEAAEDQAGTPEPQPEPETADRGGAEEEEAEGIEMEDFDISLGDDEAEEEEEAVESAEDDDGDLPLMHVGFDEDDEEEETDDLPMMDIEFDDDEEEETDDLPMMDVEFDEDEETEETEETDDLPLMHVEFDDGLADLDSVDQAAEAAEEAAEEAAATSAAPAELEAADVRSRLQAEPDDISLHQRMVELAYAGDQEQDLVEAYTGLARALERRDAPVRARAAWQQVLAVDPTHEAARAGVRAGEAPSEPVKEVAANEDYVDLGSMILGGDAEKTTRFTVAYEEPSGDEDADFAKMLSQFKDKVSENLGADDVSAHQDLGTAYKEMGLLDEAVSEFQAALRADPGHLPTYELIGQTFLEMGNPDQAVRSLERALKSDYDIEDELLGIYYYLARAYEEKGSTDNALEFYDRVFSLDINFADVTERLRVLRPA